MVERHVYPNGLRLLMTPMTSTKTVTVLVLVGTGSRYETRELNGISHFLEHMMFKGTEKRPGALDISEELDAIGAEYNAFTAQEYTGYYVKCAADKLDTALDVIADIFQHSKLNQTEIDKERGAIKEEINMYFDNPSRYVGTLYAALMFGDQPLGWDIAGPKENIDRMSRDQFVDYFDTHYFAKNTIVSVAGNIEAQNVNLRVKNYFNHIRERETITPARVIESQKKPAIKIFHKKTDQTNIAFGFRGVGRFDPMYDALEVMATIMGGGMSSRLFVEVREKRGLAYHIGTGVSAFNETGDFTTGAGITNSKITEALEIILKEYARIREEPVPDRELKKAKDYMRGKFLIGLEPSDAQASFYADQELLEHRILTPEERLAKIEAVTAEDILKTSREIFRPERLNLAVIGPFETGDPAILKTLHSW